MDSNTKRRPIRGAIWGIVLGLGLAFVAIGQSWAALGTWPPFLLLLAGPVVGVLWSTLGPAKQGKSEAPTTGTGGVEGDPSTEVSGISPESA